MTPFDVIAVVFGALGLLGAGFSLHALLPSTVTRKVTGANPPRGAGQAGTDRKAKAEARALEWLRKNDPVGYREAALQMAKVGHTPSVADQMGQFKGVVSLVKEIQGLAPKAEGDDFGKEMIRKFADKIDPQVVTDAVGGIAKTAQQAGAQRRKQLTTEQSTPKQNVGNSEEIPMNLLEKAKAQLAVSYVIGELEGRHPGDAARWLLSQKHQAAGQLIEMVMNTPDDQLLASIANAFPDPAYQPLIQFFAQRQQWSFALASEIRTQAAKRQQRGGKGDGQVKTL